MFKVIDYAGETVEEGFPNVRAAYVWLNFKFTDGLIHEMQFRVVREEVEDERDSSDL